MSHEKVDPDKEFAETHELANDFIKSKLQEKKLQGLPQGVMIEGYGNPLGHRQGHIDVKDQRGVPTGRSANEVTVGHTQHHDEWVRSV
ncbi:MAG TPA: hypothetical protein VFW90_02710, partial [Candidatus Saccharimonadales bacterium]|nr:hypothetical protein [Candidatus Saccharimonadales bacterium]